MVHLLDRGLCICLHGIDRNEYLDRDGAGGPSLLACEAEELE